MRRRRRRVPAVPREGDLVIDGHVRARLLGVKLLDLDAHVVVSTAQAAPSAPRAGAATVPARANDRRFELDGDGVTARDPRALPLARAQRLLAEGTTVLADARRIR